MPKLAFSVCAMVPGKKDTRIVSFKVRYVSPPGVDAPPTRPGVLTIELPTASAQMIETSEELTLMLAPKLTANQRVRLLL
jgi:hypothetical protein